MTTAIDPSRLEAFMGQAVVDLAASFSAPLVRLGARLGLYRGLAEGGPATPDELAERTGTEPRMVREWLWGEPHRGSRKPHVESHEITHIRATVAPAPYATVVREMKAERLGAHGHEASSAEVTEPDVTLQRLRPPA